MDASRRTGRARLGDLVLYDLILLLVVFGLLWAEREVASSATAAEAAKKAPPAAPRQDPPPPATPVRPAVTRVTAQPPAPTPTSSTPAADEARPRRDVERVLRDARALVDAGRAEEGLALLEGADPSLRQHPAWAEVVGSTLELLRAQVAGQDAWRAVLADAQLLADRGDAPALDALARRAGGAAPLGQEQERLRARAGEKPGGGFAIRGFVPDEERVAGRRCAVKGAVDRSRLVEVKDALDALLPHAEGALGRPLPGSFSLDVVADDATLPTGGPTALATRARPGEPAAALGARARLRAARAAVAHAAPAAAPWAADALARALAGVDGGVGAGGARPRLGPLGQVWRRRALTLATPEAVTAAIKEPADPGLSFALGYVALWADDPAAAPLRQALAAGREGRAAALTRDEARAVAAALAALLEPS
ncbi:MAG: hypothetical protein M9894_14725 [Planctomycetes bacterium]|nr:hypothetical protein [Planctomycetota bacterium]